MWQEFLSLFSGDGILPMIIMLIGIVLLVVELFVPGFGVFGITGGILIVAGITFRMILGATWIQFGIMIGLVIILAALALLILIISAKSGLLSFSPLVMKKTAIPTDHAKDNKKFVKLLGKTAFATTDFIPVGKFTLNDELYEATSRGEFIEKGSKVQIIEVVADKIIVKKAN